MIERTLSNTVTANAYDQIAIPILVIAIHGAIVYAWLNKPSAAARAASELSVQVTVLANTAQALLRPQIIRTESIPETVTDSPLPVTKQPDSETAVPAQLAAAQVLNTNASAVANVEPDYQASYLNNPRPAYPRVAQRMGLQGTVVLNVEVLETGQCGQINVSQSSGYAVLDKAALQTVKSWRFAPARQAGHAITRWFKVPIIFSLKDG